MRVTGWEMIYTVSSGMLNSSIPYHTWVRRTDWGILNVTGRLRKTCNEVGDKELKSLHLFENDHVVIWRILIMNTQQQCSFTTSFQDRLGKLIAECQTVLDFAAAWDNGGGTSEDVQIIATNMPVFWRLDALLVTQPGVLKHWRQKIAHTHTVLTAIFPGEPELAGFPLNSSPFIPRLCILLGQA